MSVKFLGSGELLGMAQDAFDADRDVYVCRSEVDEQIILWIEVDGEEFHNDVYEDELDRSDVAEARSYYYG